CQCPLLAQSRHSHRADPASSRPSPPLLTRSGQRGDRNPAVQQTAWQVLRLLSLLRHLSSKPLTVDPLCPIDVDSGPSALADFFRGEYFLHGGPVSLNPSSVMTAVPMRRNAYLGEFEFRTTFGVGDIKNHNRVVIRPPAGRTPSLNNFLSRL